MTHSDTAEAGKGMVLRHASLFSGIGGFELAAQWMGWENVLSCEFSDFPQSILRHHFPTTHHYGDIRQLDGTKYRGTIDVLTGGFPCQPFSSAGKRRGTEDNRFLWPEMLRVIREIQPTWIVAENVRGITSIDNGMVFERVCSELEANGYEVQAFCIPACAVGAPHRRERIWFVANCRSEESHRIPNGEWQKILEARITDCHASDTEGERLEGGSRREQAEHGSPRCCGRPEGSWNENWLQAATRLCRVDDGLPRELDGITIPKWRRESLKAYGNAIVPQVAYEIFQAIQFSL